MAEATIRDLRNHSAEVLGRVSAGEHVTVTRDGRPVAELRPLGRKPLTAAEVIERFKRLPPVDPERFRRDVDAIVDSSL
jgi:prevent-host-death family protein